LHALRPTGEAASSELIFARPAGQHVPRWAFSSGTLVAVCGLCLRLGLPDLNNAFDDLARTAAGVKTLIRP
jgi:hypothetical protein